MELFLLIGFTLWFSCFWVVVMTVFSAARSATAYVRDTIYKAATIFKVNSTRHLLACRHCCWLELQLRELWKIRINAWECCKDEANLGCKNKWHRCWMKYLRNTFKHAHMLIEYSIVLDDYWSRLLNCRNLFDCVFYCFVFRNLGKQKSGQNHLMMSLSK